MGSASFVANARIGYLVKSASCHVDEVDENSRETCQFNSYGKVPEGDGLDCHAPYALQLEHGFNDDLQRKRIDSCRVSIVNIASSAFRKALPITTQVTLSPLALALVTLAWPSKELLN